MVIHEFLWNTHTNTDTVFRLVNPVYDKEGARGNPLGTPSERASACTYLWKRGGGMHLYVEARVNS